VKRWGRNHAVLINRPGIPRPQKPEALPLGRMKRVGDRSKTTAKLAHARAKAGQVQPDEGDAVGSSAAADSGRPIMDEDEVVLFFWGNSKTSIERHAKNERERERKWRNSTIM
jgi:hypothetical protein